MEILFPMKSQFFYTPGYNVFLVQFLQFNDTFLHLANKDIAYF